jgi:hypothetical protein
MEDVAEVREGIDIVVLAGAGEGIEDGRRPSAVPESTKPGVRAFRP